MPQAAIGAIAEYLWINTALGIAAATLIAETFVYAAATYLLNRAAAALAPKARANGLSGTEINYYDSGSSIRIVYGRVRTGGMETIPPLISGQDNAFLHKMITLAGHEIDSYNYVHFDTTTIVNAQIGAMSFTGSDGAVSSGTFGGHGWIRRYRGTSTDSADRMLMEVNSAGFNNARARGLAKAALTLKFNSDVYKSVPNITFTYQGKRCYDPRLDASPGANPTNASYIAWTQNPALCLCDYLMAVYGGEYESVDIDWDTVVTAANYCDGAVNIPGATTQPRYTCNGVLFATDDFTDNLKTLVDTMLGRIIFRDGKWRIFAGSWQTPTFTIAKSDWIEGLSIRFEQGRGRRFNRMRCWYIDPNRDWQRVECLPRSNATYKTADGEETIDVETEQLLCSSEYEAQRKIEFLLRQSRNQITVAGKLPPRFQNIALWDTGTIVFDHLGWSSKTFRCVGCDMNPDGSMDGVFSEEQSTDWTDMDAADYNAPSAVALPLTNVIQPSEPPAFSATPQINGTILFDWTTPIVKPFGTQFQIIRSTNSANASVGTVVWQGLANPVPLVMPTSRHWYYVRAIANSLFSAFQPNTFGLMGETRPQADNTFSAGLLPDSDLDYSDVMGVYWGTDRTSVFSLSVTGGLSGGRITITGTPNNTANSSSFIFAIPTSPYLRMFDSNVACSIRYRANSIAAVDSGSAGGPALYIAGWTGVGTPNPSNTAISIAGLPGVQGSAFRIQPGSIGIGNWDTVTVASSITTVKPTNPSNINPTSYPYLAAAVGLNIFQQGSSQWEVDRVWFTYR